MLLLVDLDGVVYRASEAVPGVPQVLAARAALGDDVVEHYLNYARTEQELFDRVVDRRRFRQRGVFELLHPPATAPDQERWRAPEAPAIGGPYRQAGAPAVWSPEARSGVGRSGPGTLVS